MAYVASPHCGEDFISTNLLKIFVGAFNQFKVAGELLDVTLVCEDDTIKAHKLVLSACSPFFRRIIMKVDHPHPLIYLKGVYHRDLLSIIDYIYKGETNVETGDLQGFFKTARDLEILGLLECQNIDHKDPVLSQTESSSTENDNNIYETIGECYEEPINNQVDYLKIPSFIKRDKICSPPEVKEFNSEGNWRSEISKLIRSFQDPDRKVIMWKCTQCDYKATRSKFKLEKHAETHIKHLGLFSYPCQYCDKKPKTRDALYRHMYTDHKMERKASLKEEEKSAEKIR